MKVFFLAFVMVAFSGSLHAGEECNEAVILPCTNLVPDGYVADFGDSYVYRGAVGWVRSTFTEYAPYSSQEFQIVRRNAGQWQGQEVILVRLNEVFTRQILCKVVGMTPSQLAFY